MKMVRRLPSKMMVDKLKVGGMVFQKTQSLVIANSSTCSTTGSIFYVLNHIRNKIEIVAVKNV